ncbi:hypothetical protein MMC17_001051 [Xylographa soralifera]|nr:hypothetical protein [Xylographa soralifera]
MPFSSSTKSPFIKPNHKDDVQFLDPNLHFHHKTNSIFIKFCKIIVHEVNQYSSYILPTNSTDIDTIISQLLPPHTPKMAYPVNPNAREESTYDGPSPPPSTLATTTFPPILTADASSHPVIIDGYIPTHPHHFYPSLFPPPTSDLPFHPSTDTTLATLYHAAVRAAQQWSAHLNAWSAAAHDALARSPPTPYHACGVETLHPHHFFPWLFDEPTAYLPLYVRNDEPLARLYEDALAVANAWVALRREWADVEEQRRRVRGEEEAGWEGLEEAAERDGLWEQRRLDEEERERDYLVLEGELVREWRRLDEEARREG